MREMSIMFRRHFNTISYALGEMIEISNILEIEFPGKNQVNGLRLLKDGS